LGRSVGAIRNNKGVIYGARRLMKCVIKRATQHGMEKEEQERDRTEDSSRGDSGCTTNFLRVDKPRKRAEWGKERGGKRAQPGTPNKAKILKCGLRKRPRGDIGNQGTGAND